ncbi:hypothetical protein BaRGS_00009846 [Batillaria attramentaria]|uniref:Uncharacterized protein n=1 Tax=Batillaria attramentaria TaxID=370345 RepID=A0ABD0LGY1_9CAEN
MAKLRHLTHASRSVLNEGERQICWRKCVKYVCVKYVWMWKQLTGRKESESRNRQSPAGWLTRAPSCPLTAVFPPLEKQARQLAPGLGYAGKSSMVAGRRLTWRGLNLSHS